MITLIEKGEDACALCTRDTPRKGYHTHSERMGEAFLCPSHIDKLMDMSEKPKEEKPAPLFDRVNGGV